MCVCACVCVCVCNFVWRKAGGWVRVCVCVLGGFTLSEWCVSLCACVWLCVWCLGRRARGCVRVCLCVCSG